MTKLCGVQFPGRGDFAGNSQDFELANEGKFFSKSDCATCLHHNPCGSRTRAVSDLWSSDHDSTGI